MEGTMTQKTMISVFVMLWWATSATSRIPPASIHRARLVR